LKSSAERKKRRKPANRLIYKNDSHEHLAAFPVHAAKSGVGFFVFFHVSELVSVARATFFKKPLVFALFWRKPAFWSKEFDPRLSKKG
jgi:hypothetical protein